MNKVSRIVNACTIAAVLFCLVGNCGIAQAQAQAQLALEIAKGVSAAVLSKESNERINSAFESCKTDLAEMLTAESTETPISRQMQALNSMVLLSTERANRLLTWDRATVMAEAEAEFDKSIAGIEEYLKLVEDDGLIHNFAKKLRAEATDQARIFREKAKAKSSTQYEAMAAQMTQQSESVDKIWTAIREERSGTEVQLAKLKESRELYVDIKIASGIEAAVQGLAQVGKDLAGMRAGMQRVQQAVETAAPTTTAPVPANPI